MGSNVYVGIIVGVVSGVIVALLSKAAGCKVYFGGSLLAAAWSAAVIADAFKKQGKTNETKTKEVGPRDS